ncbi:DUF6634 family protein [Bosea sp. 2KB_26]|uniref:DUF6634 family protein n=1 Tax=Bosea sp. 2KB_26 TaxID=3237475 RepID=UPI003F93BC0B
MPPLAEGPKSAHADLLRLKNGWCPSESDLAHAVQLDEWLPVMDRATDLTALLGQSVGHLTLGDKIIATSQVLWLSEDRTIARTVSRWYRRGKCGLPVADARPIETYTGSP